MLENNAGRSREDRFTMFTCQCHPCSKRLYGLSDRQSLPLYLFVHMPALLSCYMYVLGHSPHAVALVPMILSLYICILQNGWTALMCSSKKGHREVVEILLQHGTNVDMQEEVRRGSFDLYVVQIDKQYFELAKKWYQHKI